MKNTSSKTRTESFERNAVSTDELLRDPLRFASGPAWEAATEMEPKLPLPAREWERVSELALDTLKSFRAEGHIQAFPLAVCLHAVDTALNALQNRKEATALLNLQNAEVTLAKLEKIPRAGSGEKRNNGNAMHYGCALAADYVKNALTECLRGIVSDNPAEFLRARVSIEDAAMCVLAARQRILN